MYESNKLIYVFVLGFFIYSLFGSTAIADKKLKLPKVKNKDNNRILFYNESGNVYGDINVTNANGEGFTDLKSELESRGYIVTQEYDDVILTEVFLNNYDIVVMGSNSKVFSTEEIQAFGNFIKNGGGALVLCGYSVGAIHNGSDNLLIDQFGITLDQVIPGPLSEMDTFNSHPVTEGVSKVTFYGANFMSRVESPAKAIGFTDSEVSLTVGEFVDGRLIVLSDWDEFCDSTHGGTNLYMDDSLKFAENIFAWLSFQTTIPEQPVLEGPFRY